MPFLQPESLATRFEMGKHALGNYLYSALLVSYGLVLT